MAVCVAVFGQQISIRLWSINMLLWLITSPGAPVEDILDTLMCVVVRGMADPAEQVGRP